MELQLTAPTIYLACQPVDFRKSIDGLMAVWVSAWGRPLGPDIVVFYNRARNKLKLLARHRSGSVLIYKRLDRRKFTFVENHHGFYELSAAQLAWLLAGLDWLMMTPGNDTEFADYF